MGAYSHVLVSSGLLFNLTSPIRMAETREC